MPRINNTPPINAVGTYSVSSPFSVNVNGTYTCEAIAGFESLEEKGVDIYSKYYEPFGLTTAIYEEDRTNKVNIVTLMSDVDETVIIPSSYIVSFPNQVAVPYSQFVFSVDCGILPDAFSFTDVSDTIGTIIRELVGTPQSGTGQLSVQLHKYAVSDTISVSEHEQLESLRLNRIRNAGRKSYFATIRELEKKVQELTAKNDALENVLVQAQTP